MSVSTSYKFQMHFDDVDHFTESTRAWDLDFCQLEGGGFDAQLSQVGLPDFQLGKARFRSRLHQRGLAPEGGRTFVLPNTPNLNLNWRGHQVGGDQLMCFPKDRQLESMSNTCFDILTVTISEERIAKKLEQLELSDGAQLLNRYELCHVDSRALLAMRMQLNRIHQLSDDQFLRNQQRISEGLDQLLSLMLNVWSRPGTLKKASRNSSRMRVLREVLAYVDQHLREPITLDELCRIAGTSERTLQYTFKQQLHMTPKQYLQHRRLQGVRRDLLRQPQRSIGDVAAEWGFWHMGQFSADYKRSFGELPSVTVKRVLR